ncbi:hypothetical protein BHE74_00019646, partial [Ensete ventricosum]
GRTADLTQVRSAPPTCKRTPHCKDGKHGGGHDGMVEGTAAWTRISRQHISTAGSHGSRRQRGATNTPIAGADRVPRGTTPNPTPAPPRRRVFLAIHFDLWLLPRRIAKIGSPSQNFIGAYEQRRKALSGMLNESHDGACLDAMKSSSPPHIGLSKDFISDLGIGKNNAAHDAWMFVKLGELYYAGSHGMDIMGPVMKNESIRLAQGRAVCASRPEGLPSFAGHPWAQGTHKTADYQLKGFFLSKLFFASVQVLEVRPAIDWNKGKAVEFLLEYLGLRTSDDVLPIYVGDDRTDEDAFKVSLITFP